MKVCTLLITALSIIRLSNKTEGDGRGGYSPHPYGMAKKLGDNVLSCIYPCRQR